MIILGDSLLMVKPRICFFIGTEAELIKVFTVIKSMIDRGLDVRIISSGQNNISHSRALHYANGGKIDLILSDESNIKKSALGLLKWFFSTFIKSKRMIKKAFKDMDFKKSIMVVHGDTISTLMGAWIGKALGMSVAHIEAGLRSNNLLHPFPEEINRRITSRYSNYHFAPDIESVENLKKAKGIVINTHYNTIIDSIEASKTMTCETDIVEKLKNADYFVLVLHRQENLANRHLVKKVINIAKEYSKTMNCIFVMHKPTEITLRSMDLYDEVASCETITLIPRTDYFDFTSLLFNCKFVVTDGGSNQEELHYMGKPCMIIRTHTERNHGLGKNAMLYKKDIDLVRKFMKNFDQYSYEPVMAKHPPTAIIADTLSRFIQLGQSNEKKI